MQHEQRRPDPGDDLIRAELVLHHQAERQIGIETLRHSQRRTIGRLQHHRLERHLCRELQHHAGAQRLAVPDQPAGAEPRRSSAIGRPRVLQQPLFARSAGGAAIAAIADGEQARAVLREPPEALHAPGPAEIAGIAVEIEQDRLARTRRHDPGDQPFTIGRSHADLLGGVEPGRSDVRPRRIARIHHLALAQIEHAQPGEVARQPQQQQQFQQTPDHHAMQVPETKGPAIKPALCSNPMTARRVSAPSP